MFRPNLFLVLLSSAVSTFAAVPHSVGKFAAFPSAVTVSTPTQVLVSLEIADPAVISNSINLQQLDSHGNLVATLGILNDSGVAGDLVAGDHIYSLQVTFNVPSSGTIPLRVSAAFSGALQRVLSSTVSLEISPPGVPTTLSPPDLTTFVPDSQTGLNIIPGQLLIAFRQGTSLQSAQSIITGIGAQVVGRIPDIGVFQVVFVPTVDNSQLHVIIGQLLALPAVQAAEMLAQTTAAGSVVPNDPDRSQQWGLDKISAQSAWNITTGSNLIIAVIDSGVKTDHEDLVGKIVAGGYNFVGGNPNVSDDLGHGTIVAGIAAANTNNGLGISGMCWQCRLLPEKTQNTSGAGTVLAAASAIIEAVGLGAKIINLSIAGSFSSIEQSAVAYALSYNRVVVAAAGDYGNDSIQYPAGYSGVISVGATTASDQIRFDSNYGAWVALYGPGDNIISTCGVVDFFCLFGRSYWRASGNSFAAPLVSGTAALMLTANSALVPLDVQNLLTCTADNVGTDPDGNALRRLNAARAVQYASLGYRTCPTGVGTVATSATIDGVAWPSSGTASTSYLISGPQGTIIGQAVPGSTANLPAGPYTLTYGGSPPPNAAFAAIGPCPTTIPPSTVCTQTLGANQQLLFTLQFKTSKSPTSGFTVTSGTASTTDGQTMNLTIPAGSSVSVAFNGNGRSQAYNGATISAWQWSIDGSGASQQAAFSKSLGAGRHVVTLVVTDSVGATSATASGTINIVGYAPPYTVSDLGSLGGIGMNILSINSAGQVVGQAQTSESGYYYHAFLSTGGVMKDLTPGTGINSNPLGVNSHGQVFGNIQLPGQPNHGFLFDGTNLHILMLDPSVYSVATAMNESGQVVGTSGMSGSNRGFFFNGSTTVDLGTPQGCDTHPAAINTLGHIVGGTNVCQFGGFFFDGTHLTSMGGAAGYWISDNDTIAGAFDAYSFIFANGQYTYVGSSSQPTQITGVNSLEQLSVNIGINGVTPLHAGVFNGVSLSDLGTLGYTQARTFGINVLGQVYGQASSSSSQQGFLFDGSTVVAVGPAGYAATTMALNNHGQMLGWQQASSGGPTFAYLYTGGVTYNMDSLLPVNSGWSGLMGYALNDAGQITGGGYYNGTFRLFLLTPAN